MAGLGNVEIRHERRIYKVDGKNGYFHTWEHYSRPIEPSPMIGGHLCRVYCGYRLKGENDEENH